MEKIVLVAFGLAWGSFLNVVIHRLPLKMSLFKPRSSCPRCRAPIKPYDNIPLLSFLILRGKCRRCKEKIPFTYPLVEFLTPAAFLLLYLKFSLSAHFLASCLFASGLIVLGFIDLKHQILPDAVTIPGFLLAAAYSFLRPDMNPGQALLGAAMGAGILLFIYGAYYLLRKKEGLGLGDMTMMLMVGGFLGWKLAVLTLVLASLAGALIGILILILRKKSMQHALPFGTFLAAAAFTALLWGDALLGAYLGLYPQG